MQLKRRRSPRRRAIYGYYRGARARTAVEADAGPLPDTRVRDHAPANAGRAGTRKISQLLCSSFQDFRALADAPLRDVLAAWQGLGYNRRATSLKKIGEDGCEEHRGNSSRRIVDFLTALPGIGYNTACAILAFAFNEPVVFIETNIRTVFIHFFFSERDAVRDNEILPLVEQTLDRENPCTWYSALMDYGTMLKKTHGSTNPRSAHYQKQPPFKGSDRQVRGMVLKAIIAHHHITDAEIVERLQVPFERARKALDALQKEGFVREQEGRYSIAGEREP